MPAERLRRSMVERFEHEGTLLGMVIRAEDPFPPGFNVVTPQTSPLQVGVNVGPTGKVFPAHWHPREARPGNEPRGELLHVIRGRVRVQFLSTGGAEAGAAELMPGDTVLFLAGHRVTVVEGAKLLEIKEGPYPGPAADKAWLDTPPPRATPGNVK